MMTKEQAIAILVDMAGRYGENVEEGFDRRVTAQDTDEACAALAESSQVEVEDVIEIRDLWRAIDMMVEKK